MHGGELELSVWKDRLERLEKELKVLDLPDQGEMEARRLMQEEKEEEGVSSSSSDGEGTPKKRKPLIKKLDQLKLEDQDNQKKKAPRRSELDLAAQTQNDLLARVDQDTLQKLRLTKKYYTDAISFIEAIEGSMDTVTELLASSVKSEVLEAMEFVKTAKEYKIEAAEVKYSFLFLYSLVRRGRIH